MSAPKSNDLPQLLFGAFVCILLSLSAVRTATAGDLYLSLNSGGDCQGSSGYGSQYFYFGPDYVDNTSAGTQYLNCAAPLWRDTTQPYDASGGKSFAVFGRISGPEGADMICAATVGYFGAQGAMRTQLVKAFRMTNAGPVSLFFNGMDLAIRSENANLGVNCAMPGGSRLAYLGIYQPKNF